VSKHGPIVSDGQQDSVNVRTARDTLRNYEISEESPVLWSWSNWT